MRPSTTFLPRPRGAALVLSLIVAAMLGCSSQISVLGDAGSDASNSDVTVTDGGGSDAPVACGATVCAAGQTCCEATGRCYDPRCLACCMPTASDGGGVPCGSNVCGEGSYCCESQGVCLPNNSGAFCPPVDAGTSDGGARSCTQASDCNAAANEDCIFSNTGCGIAGVCQVVFACGRPSFPYCGCDGQTFWDTCAGPNHPWVSMGMCGSVDGGTPVDAGPRTCRSASECNTAAGEGCLFNTAGCNVTGVCGIDTNACGRALGPYCGCDGQTFLETCGGPDRPWVHSGACHTPCVSNGDCLAEFGETCCVSTGTCIGPNSACAEPVDAGPAVDGGTRTCSVNSDCNTAANEVCVYANAGCGITGVCKTDFPCGRPTLPYCGCNGQTFDDTCAGPTQPWVSSGACEAPFCPPDAACGTPDGFGGTCPGTCPAGQVCNTRNVCVSGTDGGTPDAGTCLSDADCGSQQTCCVSTHRCYASGCLACCM